jgi:hypothetical protein
MVSELMRSSNELRMSTRGWRADLEYISGVMPENRVLKSLQVRNVVRTKVGKRQKGRNRDLHDVHTFIHLHAFVKNLLPVHVDHRYSRDAHPTRRVNHLAIQCRDFERLTRFGWVWGAGIRERVSLVQILRVKFVKDVRATSATIFCSG